MIHAQKLHNEFVRLGGARLKLKNKMLAMLPEIYESGIWEKYAGSIEEYAGKYGDIAKTTVIKRLRLEENLKDKPCLKAAISKIGIHKVALVAKIATPETDAVMAENIVSMSKMAVQSLSKELRAGRQEDRKSDHQQLVFNDGDFVHHAPLCHAVSITKKIELDENSTFLFMKLKNKLGKNLSDKEFLQRAQVSPVTQMKRNQRWRIGATLVVISPQIKNAKLSLKHMENALIRTAMRHFKSFITSIATVKVEATTPLFHFVTFTMNLRTIT